MAALLQSTFIPSSTLSTYVDVFVFDALPEPFNEDVVQGPASPVHADGDLALFENSGAARLVNCEP
jgi:hypothetical protein